MFQKIKSWLMCTVTVMALASSGMAAAQIFAAQVNINNDDAMTLAKELIGVGLKRAEAIVEYRESNGPFMSLEEITEVKGIGESMLKKNKDRIVLE